MDLEFLNATELTKMLHNLSTDEAWRFYYDETNNFRKLKVRETDFNNKLETHFVLGGIVDDGNLAIDDIIKDSEVSVQNDEIKFNNFAHGEFLTCLKSRKLRLLLKSLNKHKTSVHYSVTNALYWVAIDIVDTVMDAQFLHLDHILKSTLYLAVKAEQKALHSIFIEYKFPTVEAANLSGFYSAINDMVTLYMQNQKSSINTELLVKTQCLQQLIETKIRDNDFSDQLGITKGLLFENDGMLYSRNITLFNNSQHIFDKEDNIQEGFDKKVSVYSGSAQTNYEFVDSTSSREVQISDVIVGIISRYYDFLDQHTPFEIISYLETVLENPHQKETLSSLVQLIGRSSDKNQALIHNIVQLSIHDNMKSLSDYFDIHN